MRSSAPSVPSARITMSAHDLRTIDPEHDGTHCNKGFYAINHAQPCVLPRHYFLTLRERHPPGRPVHVPSPVSLHDLQGTPAHSAGTAGDCTPRRRCPAVAAGEQRRGCSGQSAPRGQADRPREQLDTASWRGERAAPTPPESCRALSTSRPGRNRSRHGQPSRDDISTANGHFSTSGADFMTPTGPFSTAREP